MLEELGGPYFPAVGPVAALSEEDRDALSSYGYFHLASRGDVLIPQGESHGKLFFIISGVLHAVRRDADREVLLGAIGGANGWERWISSTLPVRCAR